MPLATMFYPPLRATLGALTCRPAKMNPAYWPFAIALTAAARSVRQNLLVRWKRKPIDP